VTNGKKKAKSHTQAQNKSRCKTEIFYGPFLPIWYCIRLSFCYLDAVCSAAMGSSLCGFHVAFHMLRLLDDIPDIKKAAVSR
jgi:hypothetical protein